MQSIIDAAAGTDVDARIAVAGGVDLEAKVVESV